MPNKHAAIKDLRKNKKRAIANGRMKTHLKTLSRQLKDLVKEGKKAEAQEVARKLQQNLDKAAKKNVLHGNNASRKLSGATKMISKLK
jgi:small subunit ribosomal protein S20